MSQESSNWISDWDPEDAKFWESKGKFIARRNLIWSILAEHLGFSIWLVWSIVATKLPQAGFHFTTDQLFQLVALRGLVGSLIRFPYTFAVTTFVHPDDRARLFRHPARHAVLADARGGSHGRPWRRQFRVEHGQHFVLLPE